MKILKTRELNEKLSIQPLSKERLQSTASELQEYGSAKEMRDNFKTGDIVMRIRRYDIPVSDIGIFVSYEDLKNRTYQDIIGFRPLEFDAGEGVFVHWEKDRFVFDRLFDYDVVRDELRSVSYIIDHVYRGIGKTTFDAKYFKHPTLKSYKVIWHSKI